MTMDMKMLKKTLAMGLAAICMAFAFNGSTEAAAPHHNAPAHSTHASKAIHQDSRHINHAPRHEMEMDANDAIFFRHRVPSGHHQCTNPRHGKWAPHFHCSKSSHKHRESYDLCRYDRCHDKHPFRHH